MQNNFVLKCAGANLSGTVDFKTPTGDKQVWITLTDSLNGSSTQVLFHCNDRFDDYDKYYQMDPESLVNLALQRLEMDVYRRFLEDHIGKSSTLLFRFNEPRLFEPDA